MNFDSEKIEKILNEHDKRIRTLEDLLANTKSKPIQKNLSIREFFIEKKPEGDNQKALTFGYYLENYKNMESFSNSDLTICFKEAKEKIPANISSVCTRNVKKGYIMEVGKKDGSTAYSLTNKGLQYIENGFKDE